MERPANVEMQWPLVAAEFSGSLSQPTSKSSLAAWGYSKY